MPSVTNTDANISGNTLVTSEGARTITGLLTFDRDPNAPFAVASGSAAVSNLDADKLDGADLSANGTAYTPTISNGTLGNGTITGKYWKLGTLVVFELVWTLGSTSAVSTNLGFTLPVTAADAAAVSAGLTGWALENGGSYYPLGGANSASTSTCFPTVFNSAGTYAAMSGMTSTVPFTWGASDIIRVSGRYFAAS